MGGAVQKVILPVRFPWWVKIIAKIILARLPFGYRTWSKFGLFKHGDMQDFDHAYNSFMAHWSRSKKYINCTDGFVALELGSGDSIFSGLVACGMGAKKVYLVDTGDYVNRNLDFNLSFINYLFSAGLNIPVYDEVSSFEELLEMYNIVYLIDGLQSLKELPDKSIDFCWSQVVLEHVRHSEFYDVFKNIRRVLSEGGVASHVVDLKDHLGGGLNNLRFPSSLWEKEWFSGSGFYTNRMRYSQYQEVFDSTGFNEVYKKIYKWKNVPLKRRLLAQEFQSLCDDDLLISEFEVVQTVGSLEISR